MSAWKDEDPEDYVLVSLTRGDCTIIALGLTVMGSDPRFRDAAVETANKMKEVIRHQKMTPAE